MTHDFIPKHDTAESRGLSDSDLPAIITIDGESATGKTTQSELIAHRLGYTNVTSGMLFCAGAIALDRANIDPDNDSAARAVLRETDIDFMLRPGQTPLVSVDGRDVSDHLFDERNKQWATKINMIPEVVSSNELRLQRLAGSGRWVCDRGMRLFPDAELKIWLMASAYDRAVRRCGQLALAGRYVSIGQVMEDNALRTKRNRENHRPPSDVIPVDTTNLGIEGVYSKICSLMSDRRRA